MHSTIRTQQDRILQIILPCILKVLSGYKHMGMGKFRSDVHHYEVIVTHTTRK
jgi:hypothetical protein